MTRRSRKPVQEVLDKNHSCYVLITCGEPSEDGQIQVEMIYKGREDMVAYLLQDAQYFIEEEEEQEEFLPNPSIRLLE